MNPDSETMQMSGLLLLLGSSAGIAATRGRSTSSGCSTTATAAWLQGRKSVWMGVCKSKRERERERDRERERERERKKEREREKQAERRTKKEREEEGGKEYTREKEERRKRKRLRDAQRGREGKQRGGGRGEAAGGAGAG